MKTAAVLLSLLAATLLAADPAGLIFHLPLDEGRGQVVRDRVAGNAFTVHNAQHFGWGQGTRGPVMQLDNPDKATARASFLLNWPKGLDLGKPFTITIDIQTAKEVARKRSYQIARVGGTDEGCFALEFSWDMFWVTFKEKGVAKSIVTNSKELKPSSNTWYRLAWTYDGKTMRTYVDGMERAAGPAAFKTPARPYIVLGASSPGGAGYGYEGKMADFRIYNRALTPDEIATISAEE